MRKAGMLTTMRVSRGTAFGPGSIVGSVSLAAAVSNGSGLETDDAGADELGEPVADALDCGAAVSV